jgi:hypothetical protein
VTPAPEESVWFFAATAEAIETVPGTREGEMPGVAA